MIKLSGNDVTFGANTVSQSGQRLLTKSGIRGSVLSGQRTTGFHWNGHRFPPPPSGSVLYMPGYPAQGSVIQDFSGQGNDGAITGATWARLPSGLWYLDFDGQDDLVTIPSLTSDLGLAGSFSIYGWYNSDTGGNLKTIYSLYTSGSNRQLIHVNLNDLRWGIYDGSDFITVQITLATTQKWHSFMAVNVNKSLTIIQDGIASTSSVAGSSINTTGGKTILGSNGVGASYFDGRLALIRATTVDLSSQALLIHNQERHLFGV